MAWVTEVKSALQRGRECYKVAAEKILAAMEAKKLLQKDVAKAIGRSETWVSRLLKWHEAGCKDESVFGVEIAKRREIATSQSTKKNGRATPSELGQLTLFSRGNDGESDYRGGQREATEIAMAIQTMAGQLTSLIKRLKKEDIELVMASSHGERRRSYLGKLVGSLDKSITAANHLANELRKEIRRVSRRPPSISPSQSVHEQRTH